jgi:hypothetical protein
MEECAMKTKFMTSMLLLAACLLMPACDLLNPHPCDPNVEACVFTGNHPGTLDPSSGRG